MTHYRVVRWNRTTNEESELATYNSLECAERFIERIESTEGPDDEYTLSIEDYEVDK